MSKDQIQGDSPTFHCFLRNPSKHICPIGDSLKTWRFSTKHICPIGDHLNVTHPSIWRAWRSSQRRPESLLIGNKNIDCAPGILLLWRKKSFMLQGVGGLWKRLVLELQNQLKQHFVPLPHPPLFHPPLLKQHFVPLLQHPPLPCKAAPWSPAPGRGFCRGEEQERREPGRLRSPTDPRARAERYL